MSWTRRGGGHIALHRGRFSLKLRGQIRGWLVFGQLLLSMFIWCYWWLSIVNALFDEGFGSACGVDDACSNYSKVNKNEHPNAQSVGHGPKASWPAFTYGLGKGMALNPGLSGLVDPPSTPHRFLCTSKSPEPCPGERLPPLHPSLQMHVCVASGDRLQGQKATHPSQLVGEPYSLVVSLQALTEHFQVRTCGEG